jgi:uncharacterized protein
VGVRVINIDVVHKPEAGRYEARIGVELAGFAAYKLRPDAVVFTHTEVDDAFEGKGVGSALARAALEDVREHGGRIVPLCPFIAGYIRRHPEFHDLIAEHYRREFDAATADL